MLSLGDSMVSEFYVPMFRNTVFTNSASTAYKDGTECSETLAHKIQMLGNHKKRKNTTLRMWQKYEIKTAISVISMEKF